MSPQPPALHTQPHRHYLQEALKMARAAQAAGSSPVGAVLVDAGGEIIFRGRNRVGEPQSAEHVGDASVSHAEMDIFFRPANSKILKR